MFLGLPEFTGSVERNNPSEFVQNHTKIWIAVMVNTAKNLGKASLALGAAIGILAYGLSGLGWPRSY